MRNINEIIRERRLAVGLTLIEVANKLGVREATVQKYESGAIKNLKYDTVVRLAEILECSPVYLLGFEETKPIDEEAEKYCKELRTRPEMRMWFKVTEHASRDDIERAVKIVEAFLNKS